VTAAPDPSTDALADLEVAVTQVRDVYDAASVRDRAREAVATGKRLGMPLGWLIDAETVLRRAERAVAIQIRLGQADGTIVSRATSPKQRAGMPSPGDFATESERKNTRGDYFDLAVPDDQFETALTQARNDGNMSRANVARHCKQTTAVGHLTRAGRAQHVQRLATEGWSSRQMADELGISAAQVRRIARDYGITIPADSVVGGTRYHDGNRIVSESTSALEAIAMGLSLVDPAGLDTDQVPAWVESMRHSMRQIDRFVRTMKGPDPQPEPLKFDPPNFDYHQPPPHERNV
jgi:DNA-binding NarL/FixJ family response regulator